MDRDSELIEKMKAQEEIDAERVKRNPPDPDAIRNMSAKMAASVPGHVTPADPANEPETVGPGSAELP